MQNTKAPSAALADLGSVSALTMGDPVIGESDHVGLREFAIGIGQD
ncbi:hypothetical protein AB2M62_03560 [Sphingomonas sp. MMS12-HWE2-04]